MKKVLYFTAAAVPTSAEQSAIAALNALALAPYLVGVRSGVTPAEYQPNLEEADYAAGTIPVAFDALPVFDPDAPPAPDNLPATQAVVTDGVDLVVPVTGAFVTKIQATVVDGVITGFVLS